jgi:hypothetical protein
MTEFLIDSFRDNPSQASPSLGDGANDEELVLAWPCAFLGCGAVRIWEGGRGGFNLPSCHRCGSAVARSDADRASIRALVDKHLI